MKGPGSLELGSPPCKRTRIEIFVQGRELACLNLRSRLDVCACVTVRVYDCVCDSVHVHSDPNVTIMHCYTKQ